MEIEKRTLFNKLKAYSYSIVSQMLGSAVVCCITIE